MEKLWHPIAANTPPDPLLLGGKGANLVRLVQAGFAVPYGVILTTEAFEQYHKKSKV